MWLSEKNNGWWPGTHQEFFDNMKGEYTDEQKMSLTTRIPITNPWDTSQKFLHGKRPVDGKSVPVMTFILPVQADSETKIDPLEMLLNPEETTVEVSYIYFMPYDYVQWQIGFHVGDLEKTKVQFDKGVPTLVRASYHDSEKIKPYAEVEKFGTHPVVYNARGTHATFFSRGIHPPIMDWTWNDDKWDFWKDLDVVFPWDWVKEDRLIKTDSNLNGINYLTQVFRWGNQGIGPELANQRIFKQGPTGYLDKFNDRVSELQKLNYVCEGIDTKRCPWPMGVFS